MELQIRRDGENAPQLAVALAGLVRTSETIGERLRTRGSLAAAFTLLRNLHSGAR